MPKKTESTTFLEPFFTAADHALLNQNLQRYKDLASLHGPEKKDARKQVLNAVQEILKASHPDMRKAEWDILKTKTKAWFNLHGRIRQPRTPYVKKSKWNVHRVVGYVKKDEVVGAVAESSGAQPGDRHRFLGSYQPGLSNYVQKLTKDEKANYQMMADRWNREGLPDELRQKQADRNSRQWVLEMAEHGWKTFGMRMIVFEGHVNRKGENVYAAYNFNSKIGYPPPPAFLDNDLDAEIQQQFEAEWAHYANEALSADRGRDSGCVVPATATRGTTTLVDFERDEYDLPILPPLYAGMKTDDLNTLIRSFLVIHYAKLTRKESVHIPWNRISEHQEEFISPEYLPEIFTLQEPTRKRALDKKALIEFWLKRQNNPSMRHAFLFKAYLSGDEWIHHDYVPKLPTAADIEQGKKRKKEKQKGKKRKAKKLKKAAAAAVDNNVEDPGADVNVATEAVGHDHSDHSSSNPQGQHPMPMTMQKASSKSTTKRTHVPVNTPPANQGRDTDELGTGDTGGNQQSGPLASGSFDEGTSEGDESQAMMKTKSKAVLKPTTNHVSMHNGGTRQAERKTSGTDGRDSDGDEDDPVLKTYSAEVKRGPKPAKNKNRKIRPLEKSDQTSAPDDVMNEDRPVIMQSGKVKEKAPKNPVKGVRKPAPVHNGQSIRPTESDSSSTDSSSSSGSKASDSSRNSAMIAGPSTPKAGSRLKRSPAWDLPAPDMTGIPRSRTPTAKQRYMDAGPKKAAVTAGSKKGKGK